jgi:molybdopterin-containing oxidoreductase family membrane subunit
VTRLPHPPSASEQSRRVTTVISEVVLGDRLRILWWWGFIPAFIGLMVLCWAIGVVLVRGVGVWGIQIPVAWGFAITNFVWWIGIGHAGTFISAFLLLLRQRWRDSINRLAEAMTLFAVACAGLFPLLHLGRPELFYWLLPYPNTMGLGPQFRSPLIWDIFAVLTYLTVSILFWYVGLLPDLATFRDRARSLWVKRVYGLLAMGWNGSFRQWQELKTGSLLLAGLATALVVSVHSIVSLDFAVSLLPGWHSTIFPPYFVAGALYSGFAMVITILVPLRATLHLSNFITDKHFENMAFILIATGTIVGYGYISEIAVGLLTGDLYERALISSRFLGPYAKLYWSMLGLNLIIPQLFWIARVRENRVALFVLALFINLGMWMERFIIVITSLSRDFLPSSWGFYKPTVWDWATLFGTVGLFLSCLFLFVRLLPLIAISEMKEELSRKPPAKGRAL